MNTATSNQDTTQPTAGTDSSNEDDVPQYRLTEPSYIDDRLYDQAAIDVKGGCIIFYEGVPGAHMTPLNEAAKKMVKKYPPSKVDPLHAMTSLAPVKG